jgi:hypothetical protein
MLTKTSLNPNMVTCTRGLACSHQLFDLNALNPEYRDRQICGDCIFAEIDGTAMAGTEKDQETWMKLNGGRSSSFLNDHRHELDEDW